MLAEVRLPVVTKRLPVRVEPVQGEAIDSWLAAMARAMDVRIGSIARSFGLPARLHPLWITWLTPDQIEAIVAAAGIPRSVVESMTLSVYDGDALKLDPKTRRLDEYIPFGAVGFRAFVPSVSSSRMADGSCSGGSAGRSHVSAQLALV